MKDIAREENIEQEQAGRGCAAVAAPLLSDGPGHRRRTDVARVAPGDGRSSARLPHYRPPQAARSSATLSNPPGDGLSAVKV